MDALPQFAVKGSLFSGRVNGHVRSGQPRQWQSFFKKPLHRQFLEHFDDALVRLGYAQNDHLKFPCHMPSPQVSIVIPTFNRSGMLRRCIDSALAQTFPCEIVVCDHGSTDDTPTVARSYGDRIRYVRREQDSGVHFAWLDGVVSAHGEFIHFNFDDDFIAPTFIEKCLALMGPKVAFCLSSAEIRDDATQQPLAYLFTSLGPTGVYPVGRFMSHQIKEFVSPGATLIRRKDILNQLFVGRVPFSSFEYRGVGPDWLMTAMTTLDYQMFGYVDEPLAVFSSHEGSITIDANKDPARKKALRRAYQEARLYYTIAWLVKTFRLDVPARALLFCMRVKGKIRDDIYRVCHPKRPPIAHD
jgi:glycosyltransferase involved in cell wall biosynthesis